MNFDNLESFLAVVQHGSFRKAAEKLNKAQPAISYAIKNLETELGLDLFDRTHYKPELTQAAQVLLEKISQLVDQKNSLIDSARYLAEGGDFQVRLSITALFPVHLISAKLKQFTLEHTFTDLKINVDVLSTLFRLKNDEADIGISELLQWPYEKFDAIELCKIKMIPVISSNHPTYTENPDKIFFDHEIKHIPQVVIQSTLPEAKDINAGILSENLKWRVSDFKTKETMILESLGWGFMPDHMVNQMLETQKLKVLKLQTRPIYDYPLYVLKRKKPKKWGPSLESLWSLLIQAKV